MQASGTGKTNPGFRVFIQGALLLSALQGASFALLLFDRGALRPRRFVVVVAFSLVWTLILHIRSGVDTAVRYILSVMGLCAVLVACALIVFIPFERWTFGWWSEHKAVTPMYLSFIPIGLVVGSFAFVHVRILNSMLSRR
jgi:hypothetical protein